MRAGQRAAVLLENQHAVVDRGGQLVGGIRLDDEVVRARRDVGDERAVIRERRREAALGEQARVRLGVEHAHGQRAQQLDAGAAGDLDEQVAAGRGHAEAIGIERRATRVAAVDRAAHARRARADGQAGRLGDAGVARVVGLEVAARARVVATRDE